MTAPLIEGPAGELLLVPEVVLDAGLCCVTRTVHPHTDAKLLARKWIQADEGVDLEPLRRHWPKIGELCEALGKQAPGR